jgi:uracil-DNA glycosylase
VSELEKLNYAVTHCTQCRRLRRHCEAVAKEKKREYRDWEYWGKPVPGFGDPQARIWIVGLAPGAHGSNRTGRPFTGDGSGIWLYRALHRAGLANQATAIHVEDGLVLHGVYISSAGRCAPPENKPTPQELLNCRPFLDREFELLKNVRLFLALGGVAFKTTLDLLRRHGVPIPKPRPKFTHGGLYQLGPYQLLTSYHPSRQNTNTGVLTEPMFDAIFARAVDITQS